MRQVMSKKNTDKLARKYGLDLVAVLVRGGSDHRKDLCLRGGKVVHLYSDGVTEVSEYGHGMDDDHWSREVFEREESK